jgi:LPXTG-motif cell wall-anchored protein
MNFRTSLIRLAVGSLALAGALTVSGGSPVQAEAPPPTLTLLVDGSTIRDGSVVEAGTTMTAVAGSLLTEGTGSRELRVDLDPSTVYESGGVTAPEGWTTEWSTDDGATWVDVEPADPATVTNVRATNDSVVAGAIDQGSQRYTQSFNAPVPASTFTADTGGDGWDTFFYDDYVLNIFHHDSSAVRLSCHLRSTGEKCADFDPNDNSKSRFAGYQAGNRSGGWVDGNTGFAYAFTIQSSTSTPGVLCIDLNSAPPQNCGFVALSTDTNVSSYGSLSNAEGASGRLFGLESVNQKLLCFDTATDAACAGSPVQLSGSTSTPSYHVYPLGTKVFASTDTTLYCFEAATLAACGGAWPVTYDSLSWASVTMSPVAHMDANGTIDGVCMWAGCLDLSGADQTTDGTWVNPHSITAWSDSAGNNRYSGQYGRYEASAGRAFLQSVLQGTTNVYCFDYTTEAACVDFTDTVDQRYVYALRADPNNPACIWYNSDPGRIGLFDAITGAAECTANPVITLQPSAFAPRFVCSTAGGIDRWVSVTMDAINGTDVVSTQALTMRTGNGDAVAGWVGVPLAVATALDLSALSIADTGARPSFNVGFAVTAGSIDSADFTVVYEGRGPELCVDVTVQSEGCPQIADLAASVSEDIGAGVVTRSAAPRSIVAGGDSEACPEDLIIAGPPGPVTDLTTTRNAANDCTAAFTPPADDGGSPIRRYEYSIDAGQWVVAPVTSDGAGGLSFPVPCTDGTVNTLEVRAVNLLGAGEALAASLAPQAPVAQDPPDPTPTAPPEPPAPTLPRTGPSNADMIPWAFALLALGALAMMVSRRRSVL